MKELLNRYFNKEVDAIQVIRNLTGMINPDHAVSIITLVCTITRHEQGDIDEETFRKVWKIEKEEVAA